MGAFTNSLQLSVQVETRSANDAIKGVTSSFANLGQSAAQHAQTASRAVDNMTGSVTKGAAAGTLIANAFMWAAGQVKSFLTESRDAAMRLERLTVGTNALARARGLDSAAANRWIADIKSIGYTAAESTEFVNRMLVAQLDPAKGKALATYAKNIAHAFGQPATEMLDTLFRAVETGQSRALRRLGINVDLAKVTELATLQAKLQGRALGEDEQVAVRFEAILRKLSSTQGIAAAASETAQSRMDRLHRSIEETKVAIGEKLLPVYGTLLDLLNRATRSVLEHAEAWSMVAKGIALAGTGYAGYRYVAAPAISALAAAGASAAGAAAGAAGPSIILNQFGRPAIAAAAGAAGGGMAAGAWALAGNVGTAAAAVAPVVLAVLALIGIAWAVNELRKSPQAVAEGAAASIAYQRSIDAAARLRNRPGGVLGPPAAGLPALEDKLNLDARIEAAKMALTIRQHQQQGIRSSTEALAHAQAGAILPVLPETRLAVEMAAEREKLSTFIDDKGMIHRFEMAEQTKTNIVKIEALKRAGIELETWNNAEKRRAAVYLERHHFEAEAARQEQDTLVKIYEFQEQEAGFQRDSELRALEATDARTLQQKVALEGKKAEIETEYIRRVHEIKVDLFTLETDTMLMQERLKMEALHMDADAIEGRLARMQDLRDQMMTQLGRQTEAAIQGAEENARNRQVQIVRTQLQTTFESLKSSASSVIDALFSRTKSWTEALGATLRAAVLTPLKEIASSLIASGLMKILYGQSVGFGAGRTAGVSPAGSAGGAGGILGMLGLGTGGGGFTTPGWNGSQVPGIGGWGPAGSSQAGSGGFGGGGFNLGGLRDLLGIGSSINPWGKTAATTWEAASGSQRLGSIASSSAASMAGAGLFMDAMRRGGKLGIAEATAGGALVGLHYGGPLGAAIGAIAGFGAGLIRSFFKGATEKAREKIRECYGVDIKDRGVLGQIVRIAKESFGSNLDMAIRTQQVRDLVELYAMSTGQSTGGLPATMKAVSLAQSGGSLFSVPSTGFGSASLSGRISPGVASNAGPQVINISIPGAKEFFETETVQIIVDNGRVVQRAANSGARANVLRRDNAMLGLAPLAITS